MQSTIKNTGKLAFLYDTIKWSVAKDEINNVYLLPYISKQNSVYDILGATSYKKDDKDETIMLKAYDLFPVEGLSVMSSKEVFAKYLFNDFQYVFAKSIKFNRGISSADYYYEKFVANKLINENQISKIAFTASEKLAKQYKKYIEKQNQFQMQ